jgi:NADPH2:quinone reductase
MPDCASANEWFHVVASGTVRISVNQRFALKDAADVQKAWEACANPGSAILTTQPTIQRSLP